jgi:hypothetical protein
MINLMEIKRFNRHKKRLEQKNETIVLDSDKE